MVLPSIAVSAGDYILVHYGSPAGITTELVAQDQCVATDCQSGAWDVVENATLTMTSKVLTVIDGNGDVNDGIPFRETATTATNPTALANLQGLQDDGQWAMCAGGFYCTTETQYDTVAVNWSGTGTTDSGSSIRRVGTDTNTAADWSLGASSWGASN